MTTRIVVADDHPVVLQGVNWLLEREGDLEVVARCQSGEAALAAVREHRPDLLVLDLNMPGLSGMDVLRGIAEERLALRVVLLTADLRDDDLFEAVRLGVRGVILKDMAPELLVRCIRAVHAGGQWLEQHLTGWTLDRLLARESAKQQATKALTQREIELVRLVAEGLRNKEIAFRLGITEGTVKIHLHRIYDKLQVTSRIELANYIRRQLG
ncbi:MAG TPA: response regulator transcription factor [Geminicoccus sp.]|uniref:response regulator transcription factor n=1 Tax=Geminicoccus sp. TaxID=2024832 RepID=UPI002C6DCA21|nr:response regulator transcription factor [Geminicoccus sp.]HWL67667.1 response regulator transcription factor [Geminicoccus sp.]